ncbi:Outer membrane receptor proteins, mostly Fe transport [Zunongwangia mangrovi]|uniref:Outer membrane receptor proteins, mostly Fe transport n=1 Tax=Zunongwangia mangrovi TaxID=1334022 RepID=A0A1I1E1M2_9FLAO|nr:TonB-dependent receptor [Zunongwangia mangrovi]SFB81095.1 Outer membrane receptor proteins, mostly Fe transport [Zunongwangia mangrovi]
MEKKLLLFLFALLPLAVFSQHNLSGVVKDANGYIIAGATISLNGNGIDREVKSNASGIYKIQDLSSGKYYLQITKGDFIGYDEVSIKNANLRYDINLKNDKDYELGEVALKGESKKSKIENKGFAVNVIETKEASLRNIQTNELLNQTVGVKLRQNGGLGSRVEYTLNGLSGNSVRIFIDGIPISTYGSSFSLNSIPPSMIKRIEVYKGVVPGYLANDAMGGAINVILHKGANSNLNASVSYGSFNTFQSNLNGLYRFDKTGFTIKASAFHNYSDNDYEIWGRQVKDIGIDGRQTPITARRFNDAYESTGGIAQVGFTNVKWADQFLIGFTGSKDYKEIQHGAFITVLPYNGRFMESDATLANFTYQKENFFISGLDLSINGLIGQRNRTVNDTVSQAYTWSGDRLQRRNSSGEIIDHKYPWGSQQENGGPTLIKINRHVASVRTGLSYSLNKNHKLLFNHIYSGIDREDRDELRPLLENIFRRTSDLYKNIYSFSYEVEAFDQKLKVNIFDKYYHQKIANTQPEIQENSDGTRSPVNIIYESNKTYNGFGAALSYKIFSNISLLTSAEKAIRLPNETEVFGNEGDNVIANLSIAPEISNNYNIGFRFGSFQLKKNRFTIATNLFSRNIKDLIGFPVNGNNDNNEEVVQYSNFNEESNSQGIEAEIKYSYNNNLRFDFNLTRFRFKTKNRRGQTVDVPNIPLFTMNTAIRYSIKNVIQKNSNLNLFYSAYFTDEFSYRVAQGRNNTGTEDSMVPTQFAQDLGLTYSFPSNDFVVSFDVKNILNEAVYDNLSVQKPGRAFYLKLNYNINKL